REHTRAADKDAAVSFSYAVQSRLRVGLLGRTFRAVDLRVYQGVRETPIVLTTLLVVAQHVVAEAGFMLTEKGVRGRRVGDQGVHEVRQPTHETAGRFRPKLFRPVAALNLFNRLGQQEGETHRLTGCGRRVGQQRLMGRVVLQVIESDEGIDNPPKRRVGRDVSDPRTVHVNSAPVPQTLTIFSARANTHKYSSPCPAKWYWFNRKRLFAHRLPPTSVRE